MIPNSNIVTIGNKHEKEITQKHKRIQQNKSD